MTTTDTYDHPTVADLIDWAERNPEIRWEATALTDDEGEPVVVGITPHSRCEESVEPHASSVYWATRIAAWLPGGRLSTAAVLPPGGDHRALVDSLVRQVRAEKLRADGPPEVREAIALRRRILAAKTTFADLEVEFREAVRSALATGATVATLSEGTGLSQARIYQIRDGRR